MHKEHSSFIKQVVAVVDVLLIVAAFLVAYSISSEYKAFTGVTDYLLLPAGVLCIYLYFGWTRGIFDILDLTWMKGVIRRITVIFFLTAVLGAALLYITHSQDYSRVLYMIFLGIAFVFVAIEKLVLKEIIKALRLHDKNTSTVILFGEGRVAEMIEEEISGTPELGLRIVRRLNTAVTPDQFEALLRSKYVDYVFFAIPRSVSKDGYVIDPYLRICEEIGRPARVFVNLIESTRIAKWEYNRFLGFPSFISHTVEFDPDQLLFKRVFDVIGGSIGFVVFIFLYIFLGAMIKLTSKGPVFFKQVRVGKNGKRFILYKFRSMYIDAEERKKELMKENEMDGAVFKMKDDPRVTPLGRVMRKLSLDEFPQFINVLKGEMSLVGTRPPLPQEVSSYESWHHRRISIKPGVTGMWQISGRSRIKDFNEIVRLDLKYIDSWSIFLDIKIILKTVYSIFRNKDSAC